MLLDAQDFAKWYHTFHATKSNGYAINLESAMNQDRTNYDTTTSYATGHKKLLHKEFIAFALKFVTMNAVINFAMRRKYI